MAEAKRKLAAILSADVVGYSRLMRDDEAATVETLQQYRAAVERVIGRHNGRIVNAPGDNILAEFPSAVEAVQAAVEIQQVVRGRNLELPEHRRMEFRVGVNLGDVIEETDGTIYGDGVNIAARMEALAEAGGICISGAIYDAVEGKLGFGFDFLGEQQVKNIAKPVQVYRVRAEARKPDQVPPAQPSTPRGRRTWLMAAIVVLMVVIAAVVTWQLTRAPGPAPEIASEDPVLALPKGPRIAVLPFTNMSADPEQEILSDGLTENIITALSRFPQLFVIARNSTFQYKGKSVDVRDVGHELGVRYVLEGSVQRSGERIRVSAQLLDASDGAHLWAETYDRNLTAADIFDVQDEIREHVVGSLADLYGIIGRVRLEAAKDTRPENLDGYECYLRAWIVYDNLYTPEEHLRVRDCLERTVENDPDYADAWATLSWIYTDEDSWGYNPRPNSLDRALEAAEKAVELDPGSQLPHWMLARTHFYRHELDRFFIEAERALAMNPNNSAILGLAGLYMNHAGHWDRGTAMVRKAAKLNPRHPTWYHFPLFHDYYRKGEYEAALTEVLKVNIPAFFWTWLNRSAVYGQLGRDVEARASVDKLLELKPGLTIEKAAGEYRKFNFPPDYIEHALEGLRKAGLSEG